MPNVDGAYCAVGDLRTGDIAMPSYATPEQYVANAAEEIDAAFGHLYVTPFVIEATPLNRPTILFLKKLNWLLASGRLLSDVAAAGESDNMHALAKRYLDEAAGMIAPVQSGDLLLAGATRHESSDDQTDVTGPTIHNEDPESLVESFYRGRRPYGLLGEPLPVVFPPSVVPYGK